MSMPKMCQKPHTRPIFHAFLLVSSTRGVTAARWFGPEITCIMDAMMAAKKEKFDINNCWSITIVQYK